ncbi:MAG: hypothetical protein WAV84_07730 [Bacteroidota bacterium]
MSRQTFIAAFILLTFSTSLHAQNVTDDVQVVEVNKRVRDFPDRYDLSSPLRSFVTFKHLMAKGSQSQSGRPPRHHNLHESRGREVVECR